MTPEEANEATQRINKLCTEANYYSAGDKELEQGIEDLARLEASSFYQTWYPTTREKLQQEFLRRKQKQAIPQDATHHGQIMTALYINLLRTRLVGFPRIPGIGPITGISLEVAELGKIFKRCMNE